MNSKGFDLAAAAYQEMVKDGFKPDFPAGTPEQVEAIRRTLAAPGGVAAGAAGPSGGSTQDMRGLLWSSIDNDTSRDLDQVEWAERVEPGADGKGGRIRVRVGIADVAGAVAKGTPIDQHAAEQTKTLYTGIRNFPMLPNELSTGMTSLNQDEDRASVVTEYVVDAQGCRTQGTVYRALLRNKAQLAYSRVGPWLEGKCGPHAGCLDVKIAASPELQAQLTLQDEAAQRMRAERDAERGGGLPAG